MTKDPDVKTRAEAGPLAGGFFANAKQAARALVVERVWPPLVFAATALVLFAAVSWAGAWQFAPRAVRVAGVVLACAAILAALAPLVRLRWPSARAVADRLDRDSGASHRPAASLDDSLANPDDPVARALWEAHRARLARTVETVRVSPPSPRMAERDPYAIRFAAVILAFAAAVLAGPELYGRLASAFDWRSGEAVATAASARVDAWIDPPPFAGRPPIVVDFKSAQPQKLAVVEGSVLVVRGDPGKVATKVEGGLKPVDPKASAEAKTETRWTISGDGRATILKDGAKAADLAFAVTPSGVPTIALTESPLANISGTLTLSYKIGDRYGISGARADFALPHDPSKPAPRSLAEPPQAALQVPATTNGAGDARTTVDLSESPWAGARVLMTLTAASVSGKTGASAPVELTLPQRPFHNPLARALVEQRRNLILDPDHAVKGVETALEGLTIAPELFAIPASAYLGMNQAKALLGASRADANLLDVSGLLWAIAQSLENGDATAAERDLRSAEQALRDALKRGASDEEIKKLMDKLREAANRFANEMAKNNADQSPEDSSQQAQDLNQMMDQMEDAARNGSKEQAQAMLDQLQNMFENMRTGQEQQSPEEKALQKQIGDLEKLLRDQQALRDDTYKSDQRDLSQSQKGQPDADGNDQAGPQPGQDQDKQDQDKNADQSGSQQGDDAAKLQQRQQALRDRLAQLQSMLKGLGMKGEKGFDDAQKHMKDAEKSLKGDGQQPGDGDSGQSGKGAAVDAQGRALEALRQGAQGLQQQMSQGQGQGQGRGKGYSARRGQSGRQPGDDPLGRGREGTMGREDGMLRGAEGRTERARRVLEELRRRLGDPSRPYEERDYLERLMKRD